MEIKENQVSFMLDVANRIESLMNNVAVGMIDLIFTDEERQDPVMTYTFIAGMVRWLVCFSSFMKIDVRVLHSLLDIADEYRKGCEKRASLEDRAVAKEVKTNKSGVLN